MGQKSFFIKSNQIIFDFEIDDELFKRLDNAFGWNVPDGELEDMELIAKVIRQWRRDKLKT